jgi:hypothetical protein
MIQRTLEAENGNIRPPPAGWDQPQYPVPQARPADPARRLLGV